MAEVTVKQLAATVGTPVDKLLEQLKEAGLDKSTADDTIADAEKIQLLTFLRQSHGAEKKAAGASKITLRRKKHSELKAGGSGRKTVTVETRGKRTYVKRDDEAREERIRQAEARKKQAEKDAQTREIDEKKKQLEDIEKAQEQARLAAEKAAQEALKEAEDAVEQERREAEQQKLAEEQAKLAAEQAKLEAEKAAAEEVRRQAEEEEQARRAEEKAREEASAAEAAAQAAMEEAQRMALAELAAGVEEVGQKQQAAAKAAADAELRRQQEARLRANPAPAPSNAPPPPMGDSGKPSRGGRRGKGGRRELHVSSHSRGGGRREKRGSSRRETARQIDAKHGFAKPTAPVVRDVDIPETITVAELANRMAVKAGEVIKTMMGMGVMATINQVLDQDTAVLVCEEMGHRANASSADDLELELRARLQAVLEESEVELETRPPVVTVMGHVDHGKTSLLDYIRTTRVAAGEAGGITQHIGAYHVEHDKGTITFLDTPGHAAFTAMRARGAEATDIVVLVVAADDGAMPQTIEAVQHSRAAGVPIIVAVNKMDKEDADPERVKNDLSKHEVIPEDWGGDTMFVPVSALTGQGVDELLDALVLQAEILELTATAEGPAKGIVIEATLDKGRGPVATVLVQGGTLKRGDILVCGKEFGRVRAIFNENGEQVTEAGPSIPVQVLGLSSTPNAGDEMLATTDERSARELADLRDQKSRDARLADRKPAKLEDVFSQIKSGDSNTLNLLVKTDVQGSFEALRDSLEKLSTDEVTIRVVGGGVGGINESDAQLASASNAIMIGFNVRADNSARRILAEQDIELHYESVIYEVIDRVKASASGMLAPEIRENIIGLAEVKDVFRSPKFGDIAGCMVVDGVVRKSEPIRVLRDNIVIYEGELESLRRFKDDVSEVRMGTECGIGVRNYNDVQPGDQIEVFERKEVARSL
jgi:translation initiation factor IF-2